MTNKDITTIYFRGNEIVALYRGNTLIFKKSGGGSITEPTGVYTVRGTLIPNSRERVIQLCVNGKREQFDVNSDKTFEYTFNNVPVTNMDYFTLACKDELETIDLSDFDTSQVTSMIEAFYQCENLTTINLSNLDTSNVTDMRSMFNGCSNLTSLDVSKFDTSKVTNIGSMFFNCVRLETLDLSNFNTSNVTDMRSMFDQSSHLKDIKLSGLDTSKVTNMSRMFNGCYNLTSLDVSKFDTSNVTDISKMFASCRGISSLDVSNFNTSKITKLGNLFYACEGLIDLYLNFDVSDSVAEDYEFTSSFQFDSKLKNVVGKFEGTKYNLSLDYCPLTAQSAMVFINGLATVTEKRTLALSATTYDSLTPEQIAIATSKGWTVTRN